jgi:hypothetical protein
MQDPPKITQIVIFGWKIYVCMYHTGSTETKTLNYGI